MLPAHLDCTEKPLNECNSKKLLVEVTLTLAVNYRVAIAACTVGPFQSDALLVPDHCVFDHVHDQKLCTSYRLWNDTATTSCVNRGMMLRSFSMLQPCGIDRFNGVEFVCCPRRTTTAASKHLHCFDQNPTTNFSCVLFWAVVQCKQSTCLLPFLSCVSMLACDIDMGLLSVFLSVECRTCKCIVSRQLYILSYFLHHLVDHHSSFLSPNTLIKL